MVHEDLRKLKISDNDLNQLSGIKDLNTLANMETRMKYPALEQAITSTQGNSLSIIRPSFIHNDEALSNIVEKKYKDKYDGWLSIFIAIPMIGSMLIGFKLFHLRSEIALILSTIPGGIIFGSFTTLYKRWYIKREMKKLKKQLMPTRLGILLDEVDKYNHIVKDLTAQIEVFDQLTAIGHTVALDKQEQIIASFQQIRSDLVKAIQTERIFREKNIRPEQFSIEFTPINSLEFHGEVQQLAKIVNDASEIGLLVQEEMRKLCIPENKELQEIGR